MFFWGEEEINKWSAHVFQKCQKCSDIHKNDINERLCYTFISGNVWASFLTGILLVISPPTQPSSSSSSLKTNKKKREKQKETLMAHHPSQFMILLLLLLLSLSLVSAGMCTATIWRSFGYKRRRLDRIV